MKKQWLYILMLIIVIVSLSGCFPQNGSADANSPAGFFKGVWHGWIAPLSLIISIFSDTIRIYETNNTGWWYDFGYYTAIISGFGGLALSRNRKKNIE